MGDTAMDHAVVMLMLERTGIASTQLSTLTVQQHTVSQMLKDVSLHKVRIVSDSMSTLLRIQSLHPSQQVTTPMNT